MRAPVVEHMYVCITNYVKRGLHVYILLSHVLSVLGVPMTANIVTHYGHSHSLYVGSPEPKALREDRSVTRRNYWTME